MLNKLTLTGFIGITVGGGFGSAQGFHSACRQSFSESGIILSVLNDEQPVRLVSKMMTAIYRNKLCSLLIGIYAVQLCINCCQLVARYESETSIALAMVWRFSLPQSNSTSARAKGNAVPGPCEVIQLSAITTASEVLRNATGNCD